jgi:hypothetical protein
MASQSQLIHDAEQLLADIKAYDGEAISRRYLLNQLNKMRIQLETPSNSIMRLYETVPAPFSRPSNGS